MNFLRAYERGRAMPSSLRPCATSIWQIPQRQRYERQEMEKRFKVGTNLGHTDRFYGISRAVGEDWYLSDLPVSRFRLGAGNES